jgi:FdhE protein
MPYVPLLPADATTRLALAEARWTRMVASNPQLAAPVELQRGLLGIVIRLTETLERLPAPRLSLPPRYVTTKLAAGIPALAGEPCQPPVETVRPTVVELCRILADGGSDPAVQIREAVDSGRIDVAPLLTLTLHREQGALRMAAAAAGLSHDILWLVAELAVGPFVHALLQSLLDSQPGGSPVRDSLDRWQRGYCPLCGTWPALIDVIDGSRRLRCSFCAAAWDVPAASCVYCGEAGERFVVKQSREGACIETCQACRGYTKVVDTDQSLPFPLLAIADLECMDLDFAAMQAGYSRPALKQFRRR